MDSLKVCRFCLNVDVKLYDLLTNSLDPYFATIMIESKPLYSSNLPTYLCFECATLVKKFNTFRQNCLRNQALLCGIIDENGKLTHEKIKLLERRNLLMNSKIYHIDIQGDNIDANVKPEVTEEYIKNEDDDTLDHNGTVSCDDECMGEETAGVEKIEILVNPDSNEDFTESTELDEISTPLEKYPVAKPKQSIRTKKIGAIKNKVSKALKKDVVSGESIDMKDINITFSSTQLEEIIKNPPEIPSDKPKQTVRPNKVGATKKKVSKVLNNDVDSEENKDMEDITVITLSMEEQLEAINKRKESSNYLNCQYQCHLCYKGFNNVKTWKLHSSKHSQTAGDLECAICKYRFKTRRKLLRHALNHRKRYVCKLCPYYSCNVTTVKQHQGSHKGIVHKCDICDEVFTIRTTLVQHLRVKHPSENICCFCGYSFYSKQGLVVHKNMVHKNDIIKPDSNKDGLYCKECDIKFIDSEAFKRHMVMSVKHTPNPDVINGCRVCGETFSDREELRLHHRRRHPKRQPRSYVRPSPSAWPSRCTHCPEMIQNGRAYWKHFRLAHPNENYPVEKKSICDICGKRFACNAILLVHKRTHFGDRPYKCSQCDKACFSAFNLRVHQQKHSEHRPFPCTVCTKAFKRKEALERHLKIHSGDNPYKCEVCGVAFAKSSTRTLHVRTAHTHLAPARTRAGRLAR